MRCIWCSNPEGMETTKNATTSTVEITYGFPVYITQGDTTTEINFLGGTVAEALEQAGFTPWFVNEIVETFCNTYKRNQKKWFQYHSQKHLF